MKRLIAVALASLIITPAFACGPTPGSGGTTNMSPGRERANRRRSTELKAEMDEQKKADRVAREMDRFQGALNNNYGQAMFPQGASPAAQRQAMINRYEFLALKVERGKGTAKNFAEMRALRAALLPPPVNVR